MTAQVMPLVALRWRMVRSARARYGFLALAGSGVALCLLAAVVGRMVPAATRAELIVLAPTVLVPVAVLAVLAPLVAGGGNELFPGDQLVAFPITARTQYAASLLLTPLNLAWTTQLVSAVAVGSFLAEDSALLAMPVVTVLSYVVLVTLLGQALAWWVVGLRQRALGRRLTMAAAGAVVVSAGAVVMSGRVGAVLDSSPTTLVVVGAINGSAGDLSSWALTTGLLVVSSVVAHWLGRKACSWALRRPGDGLARSATDAVSRRAPHRSARGELLATDRASVWRSPSLRRGLLVLAVLPGLVAAAAGLEWSSLVVLPALVAAGAGLLFGVNVFCLDSGGALWLGSLPVSPGQVFWAKARVIAEVCAVTTACTVAAGSLRTGSTPTAGEAVAVGACAVTASLLVLATCMRLSVVRPHRAELRGPRDSPAPPGVMAAYSVRLAVSTTLTGLLFAGLASAPGWGWPVAVAVPLCLLSLRRLLGAARLWSSPEARSTVTAAVSAG